MAGYSLTPSLVKQRKEANEMWWLFLGGIPFIYWMLSTGAGRIGIWFNRSSVDDYKKECVKRLDEFIWPYLLTHFSDWDIDAIYAIIAWETGWLSDPNSKLRVNTYHNLLGLDIAGKPGVARQYAYYWECLHYFQRLISGKFGDRYKQAYSARGEGTAFLMLLHEAGYNSNDSWLNGVLDCYHRMSYLH